jgi:hypothetical protein
MSKSVLALVSNSSGSSSLSLNSAVADEVEADEVDEVAHLADGETRCVPGKIKHYFR